MVLNPYIADYEYFLEHVVIVADRFKTSLSQATQDILREEYPIFIKAMETGGKTFADIEADMKNTYIYHSHEKSYKARGIERTWLNNNIE